MEAERAGAGDTGALTELRLAYLREDRGQLTDAEENALRASLPGYFTAHLDRDLFVYVIREGRAIAACAFLLVAEKPMSPAFINGRTGTVMNVYTVPDRRRRGLAKKVMEALLAGADGMDLSRVELKATPGGYPLYKALGFDEETSYRLMKRVRK